MSKNLIIYLFIANLVGIIIRKAYLLPRKENIKQLLDSLARILTIIGAGPGVLIGIFLFDKKATKSNMMTRIFAICFTIIEIVILLYVNMGFQTGLNFNVWTFLQNHNNFLIYLIIINMITFLIFGVDKLLAKGNFRRISIVILLFLSFIGGAIGGFIAMYVFRHKIRKDYFKLGLPLIILMQITLLIFINNLNL